LYLMLPYSWVPSSLLKKAEKMPEEVNSFELDVILDTKKSREVVTIKVSGYSDPFLAIKALYEVGSPEYIRGIAAALIPDLIDDED
jgi:hypothetical protein